MESEMDMFADETKFDIGSDDGEENFGKNNVEPDLVLNEVKEGNECKDFEKYDLKWIENPELFENEKFFYRLQHLKMEQLMERKKDTMDMDEFVGVFGSGEGIVSHIYELFDSIDRDKRGHISVMDFMRWKTQYNHEVAIKSLYQFEFVEHDPRRALSNQKQRPSTATSNPDELFAVNSP